MDECKPLDGGAVPAGGGAVRGSNGRVPLGRGLHSSNYQLNLSRF